jgi:hypothetical protein
MSHFYGSLKGTKGRATRCGHKSSGLMTEAASYSGCVEVCLVHNEKTGEDMASVYLKPWQGNGVTLRLYEGPVNPQPAGDVDQALRCQTCVNFSNWKAACKSNGGAS